eukprot:TRINITY_DN42185_c0_g1_i1.p1 TRINITY_DN42185_c0_g1~~TRINITY_DN42185_c0_g1_i1.p1  ORF type:complete len:465 (+),score=69.15 TRINITY_DN42185_c0_g1_i1:196-1590(+)
MERRQGWGRRLWRPWASACRVPQQVQEAQAASGSPCYSGLEAAMPRGHATASTGRAGGADSLAAGEENARRGDEGAVAHGGCVRVGHRALLAAVRGDEAPSKALLGALGTTGRRLQALDGAVARLRRWPSGVEDQRIRRMPHGGQRHLWSPGVAAAAPCRKSSRRACVRLLPARVGGRLPEGSGRAAAEEAAGVVPAATHGRQLGLRKSAAHNLRDSAPRQVAEPSVGATLRERRPTGGTDGRSAKPYSGGSRCRSAATPAHAFKASRSKADGSTVAAIYGCKYADPAKALHRQQLKCFGWDYSRAPAFALRDTKYTKLLLAWIRNKLVAGCSLHWSWRQDTGSFLADTSLDDLKGRSLEIISAARTHQTPVAIILSPRQWKDILRPALRSDYAEYTVQLHASEHRPYSLCICLVHWPRALLRSCERRLSQPMSWPRLHECLAISFNDVLRKARSEAFAAAMMK